MRLSTLFAGEDPSTALAGGEMALGGTVTVLGESLGLSSLAVEGAALVGEAPRGDLAKGALAGSGSALMESAWTIGFRR